MSNVRFFTDAMLGRLALWLRVMGVDSAYESSIDDKDLVERAVEEDRIILTRDTLLVKRKLARDRCFFIKGDGFKDQLTQVLIRYEVPSKGFLTRCLRCNSELQKVSKDEASGHVPAYVFETEENFTMCPSCNRFYWQGTHTEGMRKVIEQVRASAKRNH